VIAKGASMTLRRAALAAIALACAGCIPVSGAPTTWFGGPYQIEVSQMYDPNQPDALLVFARDHGAASASGKIVGKIHGWPFPHTDPNGDFGENLFTYEIDFTVTQVKPGNPPEPTSGHGTRRVYFHPDRTPASLSDIGSFNSGQPVIVDSVDLSFNFGPAPGQVEITTAQRQTDAIPFDFDGARVTPPGRPAMTASLSGTWSAEYGGYVFR
jgi:hypothetical protein